MSTPVCRITSASGKVTTYDDLDDAWAAIARANALPRIPSLYYLGVVGSRRRATVADGAVCWSAVSDFILGHYNVEVVIVSGDCRTGADHVAKRFALDRKKALIEFPAQWDLHGKSAGFNRNEHIARLANELIAQVAPDRTGGTESTIAHFERLNAHQRQHGNALHLI